MTGAFVEVEGITTNEEAIRAQAIQKFKELLELRGVTGWVENPADLAIIVLDTAASMVPAVAQIAAVAPPAIFRKYGTELIKLPYNEGAAATLSTKWTFVEEGGKYPPHTIEAGVQLTIGELAFYVKETTSVAEGQSSETITLVASERGTEFNGLTGPVELVNAVGYVKEVAIIGESTGGVNQETDAEYQNRLVAALKLQAPRPITAANFAEMALQVPSTVIPTGVVVGRTTAIDGYNGATNTFKGKTKTGNKEVTAITSFAGVTVKTELTGSGIPAGTLVESINEGAKTLQMSQAATKEEELTFSAIGSFENQRYVTVFVTGPEGNELSAEAMEKIDAWLKEFVEINFKLEVRAPKYNEIRVKTQIHVLPGYVSSAVTATVKTAIEAFLSPKTFGNPTGQSSGINSWLNIVQGYSTVRYNQILGTIEAVPGVQYVFAGSTGLAIGLAEAPGSKTADIALRGAAPLPETKPANIEVVAA